MNRRTKSNEKVYVLTIIWQFDSGDCGTDVYVYDTLEKAQRHLAYEIEECRNDFKDIDSEETKYVDGDMCWSIWESGEYCYNHMDISIWESEVR